MIEVYWRYEDQNHHVKFQDNEMAEAEFFAWEIYTQIEALPAMTYPLIWKPRNPGKIVALSLLGGFNDE